MGRIAAITAIVLLAACGREQSVQTPPAEAPAPQRATTTPAAATIAPLPALYSGLLPCADCPGIRYDLDLREDGTFVLRMTYLEEPAGTAFHDTGSWSISPAGMLILRGGGERPEQFAVIDARTLRKLDAAGRPIETELNYDITRQQRYVPIEPQGSAENF